MTESKNNSINVSPLRIRYMFLMRDVGKSDVDGLFFASDRRLIELADYLEVLMLLPRGTTEYFKSVPRKAFYNYLFGYNSFAISFISESKLDRDAINNLNEFPLRVLIFTRDMANENTLKLLDGWDKRPLILVRTSHFANLLKDRFKSPVMSFQEFKLDEFESELIKTVDNLMTDDDYVKALPWHKQQVDVIKKLPDMIKGQRKSIFPVWALRRNKILRPLDLIINRNRGHMLFQEKDIESSPRVWVAEMISCVYRCFAEMALMEVLAYYENNELTSKDLTTLGINKEDIVEIFSGNHDRFEEIVNKFKNKYNLLSRNKGLIFLCPSINPYFYKKILNVLNKAYHLESGKRIPDRIVNALLKDTGYKLELTPSELFKDKQDKDLKAMLSFIIEEYSNENSLLSNITALYGLRYNRPRIKTQKMSSSFFGKMRLLQNLLRQDTINSKTIKKFSKLWKSFRKDLTDGIPTEIRILLERLPKLPIQFISDLPLEWIEINGTPIMFTREISRLPITSSNGLLFHYQVTEEPLKISSEFGKPVVLLIDGISESDPVKSFTKITLDQLKNGDLASMFDVYSAEVDNKEDLFALIRDKKPFICVIDAHAGYDTENDVGYLHIGSYKWNPWVDVIPYAPPIMILNSCQTSIVDGTFNTAANGLLAHGVRSIIATLFPISAHMASHICIRLFANLTAAMTGEDKLLTWREVVSKTIMLNHYLDYFLPFAFYLIATKSEKRNRLDKFIPDYVAKWNSQKVKGQVLFEDIVYDTVKAIMKEYDLLEEFTQFMERRGVLPETAFFISLGTPESIEIFDPDRAKHHMSIQGNV